MAMSRIQQFRAWGNNCQILNFSEYQAEDCLESFFPNQMNLISKEFDAFWDGYHNGTQQGIIAISL